MRENVIAVAAPAVGLYVFEYRLARLRLPPRRRARFKQAWKTALLPLYSRCSTSWILL